MGFRKTNVLERSDVSVEQKPSSGFGSKAKKKTIHTRTHTTFFGEKTKTRETNERGRRKARFTHDLGRYGWKTGGDIGTSPV